jgi:hypothetical protein
MRVLLEFGAVRYLMVGPPAVACWGWMRMRYKSGESGEASMPVRMASMVKGTEAVDWEDIVTGGKQMIKYSRYWVE